MNRQPHVFKLVIPRFAERKGGSSSNRQNHIGKSLVCEHCRKPFRNPAALKIHIEENHSHKE